MSLPPEQINIKRRREEEPVDTLYIQSELHQTKRRFTDFVFHRVQVKVGGDGRTNDDSSGASSPSAVTAAKRALRSPRSVSSLLSTGARNTGTVGGGSSDNGGGRVPLVRATSPGAEFREEKRLAAARKENEEKLKRALHSSPTLADATGRPASSAGGKVVPSSGTSGREDSNNNSRASSPGPLSVRKFQISRSSTPVDLRRSTGGGVQKRRGGGGGSDGVAVLVEKLRRKPHSRQASMVADFARRVDDGSNLSVVTSLDGAGSEEPSAAAAAAAAAAVRPRKRPVVNQAEKRWREERKNAISAAKQHISHVLDKEAQTQHQSNWEDESERLAREFEQIALELDGEGGGHDDRMEEDVQQRQDYSPARNIVPKPALRYQPRQPASKPRPPAVSEKPAAAPEPEADESDGEYVYDIYIRRPLPDKGMLTNPLADLEKDQAGWFRQNGIDTSRQDIGVIVITTEDEEYWENFAVEDEDEEGWDSEDGDSNAENNPANEYPDEELAWSDEDDDPSAIYSKYRRHGASDEEEFDLADSDWASEGDGPGQGWRGGRGGIGFGNGLDSHVDYSDDEGAEGEEGW